MTRFGAVRCWPLLALAIAACSDDTLYSGLREQAANEMVAVLYHAGLPAGKRVEAGGSFAVITTRDHFASAVDLLQSQGLPRPAFDSIGEVFARQGFVSSPLEERARLMHALSQEIAHTLSSIDGVLMARVHLAVPESDALHDTRSPASASVFVKHRADRNLSASVASIKALVVNGVEGLPYENVTVALFPATPLPAKRAFIASDRRETAHRSGRVTLRGLMPVAPYSAVGVLLLLVLGALLLRSRRRIRHATGPVKAPATEPDRASG